MGTTGDRLSRILGRRGLGVLGARLSVINTPRCSSLTGVRLPSLPAGGGWLLCPLKLLLLLLLVLLLLLRWDNFFLRLSELSGPSFR